MMAEVIVNGVALDLSDDFSITIEKNSRIMQFDTIVDTWAYNLSFPRTETNEAAFEHAERFERKWLGWQEYPFMFFFNGRLLLDGKIKVKFKGGLYEGYAFGTFGSIASSTIARNLRSLNFPVMNFTNKPEYSGNDPYCVFPLYNPYFYWERGPEIEVTNTAGETVKSWELYYRWLQEEYGRVNRFDESTNLFVVPAGSDHGLAAISPFMFAWYVMERIFANFGVNVAENVLKTHVELKKACLFTNYDIGNIDTTITIITDIWQIDLGGNMNYTGDYNETKMYTKSVSDFDPAKLFPEDWTVKDYILGIQNLLNVLLDFSDNKNEVRIIDREAIFSQPAVDLNRHLISVPELDPDDNNKVVLKFGVDNNDVLWRDNYVELSQEQWKRYKGEKDNYAALDALLVKELGDIYYCTLEYQYREYRRYEFEVGDVIEERVDWLPLSKYGQPLTIGDRDNSEILIESKFGIVSGTAGAKMLLTGNGSRYVDDYKPWLPRIIFYHGLVNGIPNGEQFYGNIEARWDGSKGLFEKRWKHTVQALKDGIPGVAYFDFDEVDFERLNLNKKFSVEEGEFIIEKSTTTFHLDKVGITEARIVKLP